MAPGKVQGGSLNQLSRGHRTNMSGAQIGLSERASLAIPHQHRFLRVPGSVPLSREAPPSNHFNSRGELIVGIDSVANIPEPEVSICFDEAISVQSDFSCSRIW